MPCCTAVWSIWSSSKGLGSCLLPCVMVTRCNVFASSCYTFTSACRFSSFLLYLVYICLSKATHQASTLKSPVFLLSANHLSTHFFIVSLLFALPTLTVGITFSILNAQQNIVNSLKLECSEYGTPKQLAFFVLPLCGTNSLIVYVDFQFWP